jgi:pimeloyl-ACP methyl ester carboxylesterase
VAGLFPALALPRTTDLVAMSFGGFVGLSLAARHGRLFERLVLVDTAASFPEPARVPLRIMAQRAEAEGIVGALDTTTPPALAHELAAGIRGARLVQSPGCAHCPPIETPDAFVAALRDFL